MEFDGGLQVVDLFLLHVVGLGEQSWELSCLVQSRSQETGNLLDEGL